MDDRWPRDRAFRNAQSDNRRPVGLPAMVRCSHFIMQDYGDAVNLVQPLRRTVQLQILCLSA